MKKPTIAYRILKGFVNLLVSALIKVNVTGRENFDKKKQYIIVANHTSWLDALLLIAKLPGTYQVALLAEAASAYQMKLIKLLIEKGDLNIIGIDRADQISRMKGLRLSVKMAREGYSVIILPEGRINPDDSNLYPFYTGVFFTAVQTGLEILPVYMRGLSKIYFRRRINMNFGTPIVVKKGDDINEVAIRTYKHLLNNVQPEKPINRRKKIKYDLTRAFLGDMASPPDNTEQMIADGRTSENLFKTLNQSTKAKFVYEEE